MTNQLQKSILQTLAFFDIFNHPLTKEELWRYLYTDLKIDYTDFLSQLEQLFKEGGLFSVSADEAEKSGLPGVAKRSRGFYFLPDREEIVGIRQSKVKLVEQKLKIAKRGIKKIVWVPFVRAVFICNTLALGFPEEDSDLDVFIIVKHGRIFLARILATLALSLCGLRRTKRRIKNKICLSFYVADDSLNLEKICISEPDIYLAYWLDNLIPVYDPDNLHLSVLQANKWVKRYLSNGFTLLNPPSAELVCPWQTQLFNRVKKILEKVWGESYGDLIEKQAKSIQQAKMKRNYASVQNIPDTRVIINDSILKFHENDRREEYRERWREKCVELNDKLPITNFQTNSKS